jgi:multidrug efflux pump subunit AcrA (membrane-fusion protein)
MRLSAKIIGTLSIFFLAFNLSACTGSKQKSKAREVVPVKAVRVENRQMDEAIEYVGNIMAQDEATIYPKVSGKIIEKVKEDGTPVEKGETIAYIDRDETGLKFEKAPVESTLSGTVGRVYVDIGQNVTSQSPIALVVNADKIKIGLDVPEIYLPRVSLGQEAAISVDAYPGEEFKGVVTKVSPVLDLATRSAPIEITVDNPEHRLKSGMFARVRLILQRRQNALVILKEAIIGKEIEPYVFVVKDNKAYLRKITLAIRQGPYYEVKEGLREGEYVVIMGQQRLSDATEVKIEE